MADQRFDVKVAFDAYASGKKTINQIADENNVDTLVMSEAIENYMASNPSSSKDKNAK